MYVHNGTSLIWLQGWSEICDNIVYGGISLDQSVGGSSRTAEPLTDNIGAQRDATIIESSLTFLWANARYVSCAPGQSSTKDATECTAYWVIDIDERD